MSMATAISDREDFESTHFGRSARRRLLTFVLFFYWLLLFIGTHVPRLPHVVPFSDGWDKIYHLFGFAGLAYLICAAWAVHRSIMFPLRLCHFVVVVSLVASYGAMDEFTQRYVNRSCEMADWYADVFGGLVGVSVFIVGLNIRRWLLWIADRPSAH